MPVDVFKGFSFVWKPGDHDDDNILSEQINVFQASNKSHKMSKNRIVANFFIWIKEIQGSLFDTIIYIIVINIIIYI